jgi:branched-chain amino acid transport system substrate-binding protein
MTELERFILKRLSRRAFLKGVGATAGVLALGGLSKAQAPPVTRVGMLAPYTGAGGEWGMVLRNTADLAAQQINAAAEEAFGGPIMELIHEDDATTPTVGVDRARKLVEIDGVPVVIGTWSSGVTVAVAEAVTLPSQVLLVVPIATSPLVTLLPADTEGLIFRTNGSDALQGVVAAQLARGELVEDYAVETAAIIYVNNPYGQGLAEQFQRSFEARGGRVTRSVAVPDDPQPTYTAELEQALADDPDVLIPAVYPGHGTILLAEARDFFEFTRFQFMDALKSPDVQAAVGEALVGSYGTVQASDPERPGFLQFAADYEEAYGEVPPLPFMDTTYDAVAVVGLAIAKAIAEGADITSLNLRDRLRPVANPPGEIVGVGEFAEAVSLLAQDSDIDYSGAAGEVDFDERGDVITPVEVWRFAEDDFETVMLQRAEDIPTE